MLDAVRVIARTEQIPNDTLARRRGVPPEILEQVSSGLQRVAATEVGQKALHDLYGVEGLAPIVDADFDPVRRAAETLSLNLEQEIAPTRSAR